MKWLWLACVAGLLVSCGVMGPPVPPEDVGVAPIIERQKARDVLDAQPIMEPQGQDVDLPPLRPVGTR